MLITMLKSKIHGARVTGAALDYQGSLTVDPDLMKAAGLMENEKVAVANMENGNRFETYVITGAKGSRVICLNGATVHKGKIGDRLIIFSYCHMTQAEARKHKPRVVLVDRSNRAIKAK